MEGENHPNSKNGSPSSKPEHLDSMIENNLIFSWSHIDVRAQESHLSSKSEHLLKDVSGVAYPGELLVIMGPSGAGKTTLLNCLTFRNLQGLTVSGNIFLNNKTISKSDLASISAYTQQDNLFIGCLTVREHLIFQALMRLKSSYKVKLQKVEDVLQEFSLKDCQYVHIGIPGVIKGISAGERKRLALASEFLGNPLLVFLDEPTTGLDSFMALRLIHMLKRVAEKGRTLIITLHQPSSEIFHAIDRLCLVAEGRIVFLGTPNQADNFFTKWKIPIPRNFNPADHYIQILSILPGQEEKCRKTIERISEAFEESIYGKDITENGLVVDQSRALWSSDERGKIVYKNGWFVQLKGLFWRSWLTVCKNPESTTHRIRIVFMEAFLIFIIYNGLTLDQQGITNMDGVLSYALIGLSFQEVFRAIGACCWEKAICIKEHNDGLYRTDLYFISKMICEVPISLICDVFITTVCYLTFGKSMRVGNWEYLTAISISVLLGQVAQGVGFIISFLASEVEMAPALVNIIVAPLMMLGGIFINISSIPFYLKWLSDLSWFKFSYEAFMINLWSTVEYIPCDANTTTLSSTCLNNGAEVLKSLSIGVDDFWPSIGNLVILAIIFRITAFLILLHRVSQSDS